MRQVSGSTKARGALALAMAALGVACSTPNKPAETKTAQQTPPHFTAIETDVMVNGKKAVRLAYPEGSSGDKPHIVSADILPGRGMNIYQVKAYLPGKGAIDVFTAPPIEQAPTLMDGSGKDEFGNGSFAQGGAILVPFANRIRGKLSADKKSIETTILGKQVSLPANFSGKKKGSELHSIHGLILKSAFDETSLHPGAHDASVDGTLKAGDFGGHWLSHSDVDIKETLDEQGFGFTVTVKNTGDEEEPIGIGWHPYFALPSGQREQARLKIPAEKLVKVNNYDEVFPTGVLAPMAGKYAFDKPEGVALEKNFYDDCFVGVKRNEKGQAVAEIIDPAAKYGVRIISISPEITAFQAYAPPDKQFIAFEPQFNWGDPFGKEWKKQNTGMAMLKPGGSVTYSVRIEVFVP